MSIDPRFGPVLSPSVVLPTEGRLFPPFTHDDVLQMARTRRRRLARRAERRRRRWAAAAGWLWAPRAAARPMTVAHEGVGT